MKLTNKARSITAYVLPSLLGRPCISSTQLMDDMESRIRDGDLDFCAVSRPGPNRTKIKITISIEVL